MKPHYSKEFRICRIAAIAQIGIAVILTLIVELSHRGVIEISVQQTTSSDYLGILSTVFWILAGLLTLFSLLMLRAIGGIHEEKPMPILRFWTAQLHRRGRSSAVSLLIQPMSLGEACVALGFVLYLLTGADKALYYQFASLGAAVILLNFPRAAAAEKLVILDEMVD